MCTDMTTCRRIVLMVVFIVVAAMSSMAGLETSPDKIEQALKKEGGVYLVVDFSAREMTLKQSGTVLREYAFEPAEDSTETDELVQESAGSDSTGAEIEIVSLLAGASIVPEAELEIIQEETHLGEEQIQRYLPSRFVIVIKDGPCLCFETDIVPNKKFHLQIVNDYFRRAMMFLFGRETLHFRMSPEDAMSLYGAAREYPKVVFRR